MSARVLPRSFDDLYTVVGILDAWIRQLEAGQTLTDPLKLRVALDIVECVIKEARDEDV
jgi:hypothetical protein